jgi:hypothetical protein
LRGKVAVHVGAELAQYVDRTLTRDTLAAVVVDGQVGKSLRGICNDGFVASRAAEIDEARDGAVTHDLRPIHPSQREVRQYKHHIGNNLWIGIALLAKPDEVACAPLFYHQLPVDVTGLARHVSGSFQRFQEQVIVRTTAHVAQELHRPTFLPRVLDRSHAGESIVEDTVQRLFVIVAAHR